MSVFVLRVQFLLFTIELLRYLPFFCIFAQPYYFFYK